MKRMETFETGTHNETWQCHGYTDAINRFLNDVCVIIIPLFIKIPIEIIKLMTKALFLVA